MKREYDFSKAERGKFYRENAKLNLPRPIRQPPWASGKTEISRFITDEARKTLRAYQEQPRLVTEHANLEHDTAHGGYAHRQIFELVQNGADALTWSDGCSILVRLTSEYLYCADNGKPIDEDGIRALMFSHMSSKRNTSEIGRFGLGFKSVLGVTDVPEFYSRPGSFRFDRQYAAQKIAAVAPAERYPVLRLPIPIDACTASEADEDLGEMMTWATNVIRLPLNAGAGVDLSHQLKEFPPHFLLFVDHVRYLSLEDGDRSRDFSLRRMNGEFELDTGERSSRWKRFKTTHELSVEARKDRRSLDDSGNVPIWWAVPLDRLNEPGYYWSFFPTKTASFLSGILNAPWKTNEDRQNLLPGPYNDELIDATARMVADHLPELATRSAPARHLDALPRRHASGDNEHGDRLRDRLDEELRERAMVPDQVGTLRNITELSYAPKELTRDRTDEDALDIWASFENRPLSWLHHSALTVERMAKIDRLWDSNGYWKRTAPRSPLSEWLESLVNGRDGGDAINASVTALQAAASIPEEIRKDLSLGRIVLTRGGVWRAPDPDKIFLSSPDEGSAMDSQLVHSALVSDDRTSKALRELGITHFSADRKLRLLADQLVGYQEHEDVMWVDFWDVSRAVGEEQAYEIISEASRKKCAAPIHARVQAGSWRPLHSVLLPGRIVPSERNQDREVSVDIEFHRADLNLLRKLGATAEPMPDYRFSSERSFRSFENKCRLKFTDRELARNPHRDRLRFDSTTGSGPLEVLELLSEEGKARYTEALLLLDNTYSRWTMRHDTQPIYEPLQCSNPAIEALCEYGIIRCADRYIPLADILGLRPTNQAALLMILRHPMAARIKQAFGLTEPVVDPVGEESPVHLTDSWPGLKSYLSGQSRACSLIRCDDLGFNGGSDLGQCLRVDTIVYLVSTGDELSDLRLVTKEIGLNLSEGQLEAVLQYTAPEEILARRAAILGFASDAEKLLHAVGEERLRAGLPSSLLAVLESRGPLVGVEVAQAAIATYDTAALKEYSDALDHLDPPERWAGSDAAVDFVRALGFSVEWAGRHRPRRSPFLEVDGPRSLPDLHDYQKRIVGNVRNLLHNGHGSRSGRRGMISLPTGSGKTRVAVQAVVEAMHDDFDGGVLWVADRDELCEQAVDAWQQVWASVGVEGKRLRVSRMWAGQPRPRPASDQHVIVATIQTMYAKLSRQPDAYRFLADFKLVVFDEAHRSVAPTYTTVMADLGMTRWKRDTEPFLIGLTATPYRGHDEAETARLVSRYGRIRLDAGAFSADEPTEVIAELQEMKVLAHADHQIIEGGEFSLSDDELKEIQAMRNPAWLPRSMEAKIARDAHRTRRIIDAYGKFVSKGWAAIIFATSVEHAQTLAALLNSEGVRARAVSGGTEASIRRDIVERFRGGQLDVLVNYAVFREGFDAPKTRVIIVARPVYSPNLYFQMIGRGLRGPRNGGNDRCLIVNVRDNIDNFDRALAFDDPNSLWA